MCWNHSHNSPHERGLGWWNDTYMYVLDQIFCFSLWAEMHNRPSKGEFSWDGNLFMDPELGFPAPLLSPWCHIRGNTGKRHLDNVFVTDNYYVCGGVHIYKQVSAVVSPNTWCCCWWDWKCPRKHLTESIDTIIFNYYHSLILFFCKEQWRDSWVLHFLSINQSCRALWLWPVMGSSAHTDPRAGTHSTLMEQPATLVHVSAARCNRNP